MMIPFIMEEAEALKDAMAAIKRGQPIGDSIGPMIVGELMLDTKKENVAFETISSKTTFEDRELILLKAEGPNATVGRPGDGFEKIISSPVKTISDDLKKSEVSDSIVPDVFVAQ